MLREYHIYLVFIQQKMQELAGNRVCVNMLELCYIYSISCSWCGWGSYKPIFFPTIYLMGLGGLLLALVIVR